MFRRHWIRETVERDPLRSLERLVLSPPPPPPLIIPEPPVASKALAPWTRQVEDRRSFHPLGPDRPLRTEGSTPVRSVASPKNQTRVMFKPEYGNAQQVMLCVRRRIRREVIMAKHGGGASHRRKRRNQFSDIGC